MGQLFDPKPALQRQWKLQRAAETIEGTVESSRCILDTVPQGYSLIHTE